MGNMLLKKSPIVLIFLFMYSYALVRYHIGKEVAWSEWYFILNKAFAWSAFTFIAMSILKNKVLEKFHLNRKTLGISGYILAIIHVVGSYLLLNAQRYDKLYSENELSLKGWCFLMIGVAAILIFSRAMIASLQNKPSSDPAFKYGKYGMAVIAFHPLVLGISGWFDISTWPLFLPPITLVAFTTYLVILFVRKRTA